MAHAPKEPKVTLYWLNESRAHRILWLLEELAVPYSLKTFTRGPDKFAPKALKQVHPLGKAPVVTIETPGSERPLVLAESAFVVEYLLDHFGGGRLIPRRWKDNQEDGQRTEREEEREGENSRRVGGETEEWLRYRYYMHYTEGSLMPNLVMKVVTNVLRTAPPPLIRSVFSFVASKIEENFLDRNFTEHFDFLEEQLRTAPGGGPYITGQILTAADIMMSYPVIESLTRVIGQKGFGKDRYPLIRAYAERLQGSEGYKRAVAKIVEITGEFVAS
ncbi:putative glutathione S-transferase [Aspergillus karnatakaensis]|uniref:glutathione S-transferase n=1 Tax=Aspergillus karnatakaensis TaxID=1810916 RepID=UPI003CCD1522